MANFLQKYYEQASQRQAIGVEPLALNADSTNELCDLLKNPPIDAKDELLHLLKDRINPGVDESSKIKADFLYEIATGKAISPIVDKKLAVALLGNMKGGFNVGYLVSLLSDKELAADAEDAL